MTADLASIAQDIVARAIKAGASSADALALDAQSVDIGVREGRVENLEQSESREIGLRVFAGKSFASVATSALSGDSLDRAVEQAVAMAKAAPPDPLVGLAETNRLAQSFPDLDLAASDLPGVEDLKSMALEAEGAALSVKGVTKSDGSGGSASRRIIALAASNGFAGTYQRTGVSLSVSAIAGEGTAMERDYDYSTAIHGANLRAPADIGRGAGKRAARRVNPRKIASQSVPVIFDWRAASSLVGHMISGILGSSVSRGTSFLKDKLGEKIFPSGINIIDNPLRRRGLASRPFDLEGLAAGELHLVAGGVLQHWLLDLYSARKLSLQSNGRASRGLSGPPGPSATNVHLEPGTATPEDLVKSLKRGFLATELIGHGPNTVTGDYSRGASGYWIENGEITYPVSEVTLAGKLLDMFAHLTPADDLKFRSTINVPSCLIEGMTLGGR
jgi:PmbA protein